MGQISDQLRERTIKPNPNRKYMIGQMGTGSTYGPYPGDVGLIIPKLLGLGKDETLLRLGQIREFSGKDTWECGVCMNKFASPQTRDMHHRKRHGERRGPIIKNLDELSPEAKENFRAEVAGPNYGPRNPNYYTAPDEFMVGDPEDAAARLEEKVAAELAPIQWDKTKASKKK